ncbi:MAG: DUF3365 domain-containing protein [Desulfurivibrionaceae bacterium]
MKGGSIVPLALGCACLLTLILPFQVLGEDAEIKSLKAEALSIAKRFGENLKPRLKEALKNGGPVKAIDVCSNKAPQIARELSLETGWQVKRVSLKPRNSRTASPDEWERAILQKFNERQALGEPPDKLAHGEIVDGRFRFLKAQPVESLCLLCHGKTIAEPVKNALKLHYPNDKATGYSLGEIRGAFSLSKKL